MGINSSIKKLDEQIEEMEKNSNLDKRSEKFKVVDLKDEYTSSDTVKISNLEEIDDNSSHEDLEDTKRVDSVSNEEEDEKEELLVLYIIVVFVIIVFLLLFYFLLR